MRFWGGEATGSLILSVLLLGSCPVWGRADEPVITFQDVTATSKVAFQFYNGTRDRHDLPEIMGGGVGLIDIDADGWLDIYLCDGGPIVPGTGVNDPPSRLFRSNRDGTFTDVTAIAHAPGPSYAMGVAAADYDGDGRDDLFVTGWRDQRLYRNAGAGRFEDVTARAGLSSGLWSTSAAFADLDGDGDLDLYVANYLEYDAAASPFCSAPDGRRDYCGPEDFPAQPDRLYRNNGDGTFTDVSERAGVAAEQGRGLGVLIADLTGNALPDIYVANDGSPCWLFENLGGLRFREVGLKAGVALDDQGDPLAGMGVALGDLDGDGRDDLVVTNFHGRSTIAFQSRGNGLFADCSLAWGLPGLTRGVLGFGLALEDFDGDGRPDLFQVNGHVLDRERLGVPFAMRPSLLRNEGGRFQDRTGGAGPWFEHRRLGRGLAVGDLDRDGRPDVVVNALDAPASLLRNTTEAGHSWLTLDLAGQAPTLAVGARVRVSAGGRVIARQLAGGGSYLSASSPRLALGIGTVRRADRVEVAWPSGRFDVWTNLDVGRVHRLAEGQGSGR
ncbi:MAG: CRTAC1 family protein [Isosphaeraceae bacterium]|nr:CRTAC1 family protein [Isosphaeraceae bacterium]